MTTREILQAAKAARPALQGADTQQKNTALLAMADALEAQTAEILAANAQDMDAARGTISEVMLDRLALTKDRIAGMAVGVRQVAALPDPVGRVLRTVERPNGLVIRKVAVPMGVVAIIYESRPNVTSDAAALAVKAGSACVLRCGKEAHRSAAAIVAALKEGLSAAGLECFGGVNAPYIWLKTPDGMGSWDFFDLVLDRANVATTPGAGFGPSGEGYIRLTAFGDADATQEAVDRIRAMLDK